MRQVLLVGSGRSGTTALFNSLAAGLEVTSIPAVAGRFPALLAPGLLANRAGLRSWVFRPSSETLSLFASCGLSQDRMMALGRPMESRDLDEGQKRRLADAFGRAARIGPFPTVISKNTGNTARIDALVGALPTAEFIYISRDPRAVVSSLIRVGFWNEMPLWWSGQTPLEMEAAGWSSAQVAATHWVQQVTAAERSFESIAGERVHRLTYESLVTSPQEEIDRLLDFVAPVGQRGEGVAPEAFRSTSLESWRTTLSLKEIDQITEIAAAQMEWYGYV